MAPTSPAQPIQGGWLHNLGIGLASLTGVGALAYGGYRYYRHRQRENTLQSIHDEQAPQQINQLNYFDPHGDMDQPSLVQATNPNAAQDQRTYNIDINDDNPVGLGRTDDSLRRIAEIHERTHVSADQSYSSNEDQSRLWLLHGDPDDPGYQDHQQEQYQRIADRLIHLEGVIQNDNALTEDQRGEMLQRVNYAGQLIEYDPVVNELLAYTREYGIRANSRTVKALVKLARENLGRRQGGQHLQGAWPG
jgi:hypothetical protein